MRYAFRLAELLGHTPDRRKRPGTIKSIVEHTGLDPWVCSEDELSNCASERGVVQSAYQIRVAESAERLASDPVLRERCRTGADRILGREFDVREMVLPLVVSSSLLFYLGMAFAFYVVFPLVFAFIVSTAPEGVTVMTDMADYLDFVLTLFFAFGVAFEIPIATIILLWTGVVTRESLAKGRPYIIVGAFVIGMLLTPPDVISQVLLALPMWVLFEAGLVASRFFIKKRDDEDAAEEEAEPAAETSSASAASAGQAADTHGAAVDYPDDYVEPTDEEMEQALDSLDEEDEEESESELPGDETSADDEADEARAYEQRYREEYDEDEEGYYDKEEDEDADAIIEELVDSKLNRIMSLRMEGEEQAARALLYEVLSEGNEDQKRVARNILQQMDT